MSGAVVAVGCYSHNCDGDVVYYGRASTEGSLLDANTWETNPVDGIWLDFPKQRTWIFDLHELGDRVPAVVIPYVSAQQDPLHEANSNFTIGSGNIAQISGAQKGQVAVQNGTCADYYIRVVVTASPEPPVPASTSADASMDATTD